MSVIVQSLPEGVMFQWIFLFQNTVPKEMKQTLVTFNSILTLNLRFSATTWLKAFLVQGQWYLDLILCVCFLSICVNGGLELFLSCVSGVVLLPEGWTMKRDNIPPSVAPCCVHQWVRRQLQQQAPTILWPQLLAGASTMEVLNMAHSDSRSPASPGILEKLFLRWELKILSTFKGGNARTAENILIHKPLRTMTNSVQFPFMNPKAACKPYMVTCCRCF